MDFRHNIAEIIDNHKDEMTDKMYKDLMESLIDKKDKDEFKEKDEQISQLQDRCMELGDRCIELGLKILKLNGVIIKRLS